MDVVPESLQSKEDNLGKAVHFVEPLSLNVSRRFETEDDSLI